MKPPLLPLMRIGILAFGYLYATSKIANAQVTSDGTVNTEVNQTDNVSEITGGETRGDNLFHSFQEFSIRPGNQAFFNNANAIKNIFSRVTGGNVSSIDGLIRANGSASLFLINPAGIIFGEGARLDIGGSFYGSSADSILFEDGEFSATDLDNPPVLTINAPIGLNFRDNPEDIANNSVANDGKGLGVAPGKTLTLLGGNVSFNGGAITAPVGRVELGGLSLAGTIGFNNDGSLSFPEGVTRGNVFFNQGAVVGVSGTEGGNLTVNANNLEISGNSILQGGTFASTGIADGQSGDIILNATSGLKIDGSTIDNVVEIGNGGALNITTPNLALTNGGKITASTLGQGNAGNITINVTDSVSLDTGRISTSVGEGAEGNDGALNITTSNLALTNGGQIVGSTLGQGDGGTINIDATESVTLDGTNAAIFNSVEEGAVGNGGALNITTSNLALTNGGVINASSSGTGNGGSIFVKADTLSLDDGKIFAANIPSESLTENSAPRVGGNITLEIAENLSLRNESLISVEAGSNATGGLVGIEAGFVIAFPSQSQSNGNNIAASAEQGQGGNIKIIAESIFNLKEREDIDGNGANDIDASSDFGLDGTISITTPGINPVRGATELPNTPVEPEKTTAQACRSDLESGATNGLTVKGKGGIPPAPDLPLNSQTIIVNGQDVTTETNQAQYQEIKPIPTSKGDIIPAQGVVVTEDGRVILTAYRTDSNSRVPQGSANCGR